MAHTSEQQPIFVHPSQAGRVQVVGEYLQIPSSHLLDLTCHSFQGNFQQQPCICLGANHVSCPLHIHPLCAVQAHTPLRICTQKVLLSNDYDTGTRHCPLLSHSSPGPCPVHSCTDTPQCQHVPTIVTHHSDSVDQESEHDQAHIYQTINACGEHMNLSTNENLTENCSLGTQQTCSMTVSEQTNDKEASALSVPEILVSDTEVCSCCDPVLEPVKIEHASLVTSDVLNENEDPDRWLSMVIIDHDYCSEEFRDTEDAEDVQEVVVVDGEYESTPVLNETEATKKIVNLSSTDKDDNESLNTVHEEQENTLQVEHSPVPECSVIELDIGCGQKGTDMCCSLSRKSPSGSPDVQSYESPIFIPQPPVCCKVLPTNCSSPPASNTDTDQPLLSLALIDAAEKLTEGSVFKESTHVSLDSDGSTATFEGFPNIPDSHDTMSTASPNKSSDLSSDKSQISVTENTQSDPLVSDEVNFATSTPVSEPPRIAQSGFSGKSSASYLKKFKGYKKLLVKLHDVSHDPYLEADQPISKEVVPMDTSDGGVKTITSCGPCVLPPCSDDVFEKSPDSAKKQPYSLRKRSGLQELPSFYSQSRDSFIPESIPSFYPQKKDYHIPESIVIAQTHAPVWINTPPLGARGKKVPSPDLKSEEKPEASPESSENTVATTETKDRSNHNEISKSQEFSKSLDKDIKGNGTSSTLCSQTKFIKNKKSLKIPKGKSKKKDEQVGKAKRNKTSLKCHEKDPTTSSEPVSFLEPVKTADFKFTESVLDSIPVSVPTSDINKIHTVKKRIPEKVEQCNKSCHEESDFLKALNELTSINQTQFAKKRGRKKSVRRLPFTPNCSDGSLKGSSSSSHSKLHKSKKTKKTNATPKQSDTSKLQHDQEVEEISQTTVEELDRPLTEVCQKAEIDVQDHSNCSGVTNETSGDPMVKDDSKDEQVSNHQGNIEACHIEDATSDKNTSATVNTNANIFQALEELKKNRESIKKSTDGKISATDKEKVRPIVKEKDQSAETSLVDELGDQSQVSVDQTESENVSPIPNPVVCHSSAPVSGGQDEHQRMEVEDPLADISHDKCRLTATEDAEKDGESRDEELVLASESASINTGKKRVQVAPLEQKQGTGKKDVTVKEEKDRDAIVKKKSKENKKGAKVKRVMQKKLKKIPAPQEEGVKSEGRKVKRKEKITLRQKDETKPAKKRAKKSKSKCNDVKTISCEDDSIAPLCDQPLVIKTFGELTKGTNDSQVIVPQLSSQDCGSLSKDLDCLPAAKLPDDVAECQSVKPGNRLADDNENKNELGGMEETCMKSTVTYHGVIPASQQAACTEKATGSEKEDMLVKSETNGEPSDQTKSSKSKKGRKPKSIKRKQSNESMKDKEGKRRKVNKKEESSTSQKVDVKPKKEKNSSNKIKSKSKKKQRDVEMPQSPTCDSSVNERELVENLELQEMQHLKQELKVSNETASENYPLSVLENGDVPDSSTCVISEPQNSYQKKMSEDISCPFCCVFLLKSDLQAHNKKFHKFRCAPCKEVFFSKAEQLAHRNKMHMKQMHVCTLCEKGYLTKAQFQKHFLSREHQRLERVRKMTIDLYHLKTTDSAPTKQAAEPCEAGSVCCNGEDDNSSVAVITASSSAEAVDHQCASQSNSSSSDGKMSAHMTVSLSDPIGAVISLKETVAPSTPSNCDATPTNLAHVLNTPELVPQNVKAEWSNAVTANRNSQSASCNHDDGAAASVVKVGGVEPCGTSVSGSLRQARNALEHLTQQLEGVDFSPVELPTENMVESDHSLLSEFPWHLE